MERFEVPERLYHTVKRLRFVGPTEQAVFNYVEPVMAIIDVTGVYRFLAERARHAGAEVRTSTRATDATVVGGRVHGATASHGGEDVSLTSQVTVDASGYRSVISKSAGLHPGFERFGVGAEVELIAPAVSQDEAVMIVGDRYAPAGYGWVFPWGEGRVRIGVGIHHADVRDNPSDLLSLLLEEAADIGVDLTDSVEVETHRGLIPAHSLPDRLVMDGLVAVGDAACQATLVVGEGIRVSLDAGAMAGQVIAGALKAGATDAAALGAYEKAFRARYGRSLRLGAYVNRRLSTFDDPEWDEKIRLLTTVPPEVLALVLQSEFGVRTTLVPLLRNPRLVAKALQTGLRAATSSLPLRAERRPRQS
jgi:digeranylgeranylglycerophospholipid reductase